MHLANDLEIGDFPPTNQQQEVHRMYSDQIAGHRKTLAALDGDRHRRVQRAAEGARPRCDRRSAPDDDGKLVTCLLDRAQELPVSGPIRCDTCRQSLFELLQLWPGVRGRFELGQ